MKLAVTGHRPHKLNNEYSYSGPCSDYLRTELKLILVEHKPSLGITGMALGADTLFALACLELEIPLLAAIPFEGQEKNWPTSSKKLYNEILSNKLVTQHLVTNGSYSQAAFQTRNEYMVDLCDKLVAIHDGTKGGTYNTVRYAQSVDREIILINPQDYNSSSAIQGSLF